MTIYLNAVQFFTKATVRGVEKVMLYLYSSLRFLYDLNHNKIMIYVL